MAKLDPERLVFLDETSAYLNLSRSYGRAPTTKRVVDDAPKGKKERVSLLAAVTLRGLEGTHCLVHPENVNKAAFISYLKTLLPNLKAGSVLVLDNWRVHTGPDVRELVEKYHGSLLPAYSPDFNPEEPSAGRIMPLSPLIALVTRCYLLLKAPFELLFSKIKAFVKKLCPSTLDKLIQAFKDAVLSVTPDDATNT